MRADAGTGGAPVKLNTTADAIIPMDNADSWIVGSDRMVQDTADTTKDRRAFFNKVTGAFRAGFANDHWNDINVGPNSSAFGLRPKASGDTSHAQGFQTNATGSYSHAEGGNTTASGHDGSHAEGSGAIASGRYGSHAEGQSTTASGNASHAEGSSTIAGGSASHAEGQSTTARGSAAHAEGNGSNASADNSHAQGWFCRAEGTASSASGHGAVATRFGQHAHGVGLWAGGQSQLGNMVVSRATTDATPTALVSTPFNSIVLTGVDTSVLTVSTSRAFTLKVTTVARRTDVQGEMAGFTWEGLVGRDATGNARIIGIPVQAAWGDAPATDTWSVAVSINTTDATNNYVAVTVTGEALKTIRWVAKMEWVEVAG